MMKILDPLKNLNSRQVQNVDKFNCWIVKVLIVQKITEGYSGINEYLP